MSKPEQRVPLHGDRGHWIHISESARNVRVVFGGEKIADTKHAKLLREDGVLPVYYFPESDVRPDLMIKSDRTAHCPYKGEAAYWSLKLTSKTADNAAWSYVNPLAEASGLRDHFAFEWNKMDAWYEEDEEIFVHPRDPFKRVDVLPSKRHVRIVVDGQTIAETRHPRLLFETNHPVRYYIPQGDVRMDMLEKTDTTSRCPYKGFASYWSVKVGGKTHKDLVWGYLYTIPECPKVKDLVCFFPERGAEIYVDGEKIPTPQTKWATVKTSE